MSGFHALSCTCSDYVAQRVALLKLLCWFVGRIRTLFRWWMVASVLHNCVGDSGGADSGSIKFRGISGCPMAPWDEISPPSYDCGPLAPSRLPSTLRTCECLPQKRRAQRRAVWRLRVDSKVPCPCPSNTHAQLGISERADKYKYVMCVWGGKEGGVEATRNEGRKK